MGLLERIRSKHGSALKSASESKFLVWRINPTGSYAEADGAMLSILSGASTMDDGLATW
jgi:hypothetical protein